MFVRGNFVLFLGRRMLLTSFAMPQVYALVILDFLSLCLAHGIIVNFVSSSPSLFTFSTSCPAFFALPLCILVFF